MDTHKIIFSVTKLLLGLPMIIFGLNKFLGFIQIDPPVDPAAQTFLGAMFTTYLFRFVAIIEIVGGIMLLIPRTAFIGTLMLLPIIANIVLFHLAHDMPGNGIWVFPTIMTVSVLYFFKDNFKSLAQ